VYACLFAAEIAKAFWMPARQAFLPRIVPMDIFKVTVIVEWRKTAPVGVHK